MVCDIGLEFSMNRHFDINWLFHRYYKDNPDLRRIVVIHSEQVAKKALNICHMKKLPLDPKTVYCAALIHDIGVVKCNAPEIHAFGHHPYLQHGLEGEKILKRHNMMMLARICSTHTGAGISKKDIINNNLPLPQKDMIPKTLLEKLICYADKFYSKSGDLRKEKTLDEVISQISNFGPDSLSRFMQMHHLFNLECK